MWKCSRRISTFARPCILYTLCIVVVTFHEFLLSVLFIQVNNNRPSRLFRFSLLPHHEALLHGQQAVHLVTHQQHTSISGPLIHHLGPGHRRSGRGGHTVRTVNGSIIWPWTFTRVHRPTCYVLVLIVENVNFERAASNKRGVGVRGKGLLGWEPEVKLRQPVLKRVHLLKREIKTFQG